MGFSDSEQRPRAARYLALVNLTGFERSSPGNVRRYAAAVSIARALSFDPALLPNGRTFGALGRNRPAIILTSSCCNSGQTGKTVLFVNPLDSRSGVPVEQDVVMSPRPGRIIDINRLCFPRDRTLKFCRDGRILRSRSVCVSACGGASYDE